MIVEITGSVCNCCAMIIANNDDSSCRDYYEHDEVIHPKSNWNNSWYTLDKDSYEFDSWLTDRCISCDGEIVFGDTVFNGSCERSE